MSERQWETTAVPHGRRAARSGGLPRIRSVNHLALSDLPPDEAHVGEGDTEHTSRRRPAPHGGHTYWRCGQKTCSSRRTHLLEVWSEDLLLKENTATGSMVRRPAPQGEHSYCRYGQKACSSQRTHLLEVWSEGLLPHGGHTYWRSMWTWSRTFTVGTFRGPAPHKQIYCRNH